MTQTQFATQFPVEVELKLALITDHPADLEKKLCVVPLLAECKASRQQLTLHNTYYDTPQHKLRRKHVALRLRRVESDSATQWLQTLKIGGGGDSAFTQRGEWESPVPGSKLTLTALKATPWFDLDPQGQLFRDLAPSFVTSFERISWTVERRGSAVEVSLDIGGITVQNRTLPLCELEIELVQGKPSDVFEVARQITRQVAVLPEHRSKAERGYALAEETLNSPVRAQPPLLRPKMKRGEAAQRVLREMFCQFTANFAALRQSDDPEVLHQARVGWRRFRSAVRLFKPLLPPDSLPSWLPLNKVLELIGESRDLDVARTETLPGLALAYTSSDERKEDKWQSLMQTLTQAVQLKREAICNAMDSPEVGASLLAITQWLDELPQIANSSDVGKHADKSKVSLQRWAEKRIAHLHDQFGAAQHGADTLEAQHRVRILAKRLRYSIEAFRPLLPKRQAKKWHEKASGVQTAIGASRDIAQANVIIANVKANRELVEFLRGVAVGQTTSTATTDVARGVT